MKAIDLEAFAQALRVSHCSSSGEHACVGTCKITQKGVELECTLCGSDKKPIAPSELLRETRIARAAIEAAGMSWSCLSDHAKRAAHEAVCRETRR